MNSLDTNALSQSGTFSFVANDIVATVNIAGTNVALNDLQNATVTNPVEIITNNGIIKITNYNGTSKIR